MNDMRKLLSEARDRLNHEKDCAFIRVGLLKCTCYHQDLYNRIDAALAEPEQEPIGKVTESGVVWANQNPHAFPIGTKFYTKSEAK